VVAVYSANEGLTKAMTYENYYQSASTVADTILAGAGPSPETAGTYRRGLGSRSTDEQKSRLKAAAEQGIQMASAGDLSQDTVAVRMLTAMREARNPEQLDIQENLSETVSLIPGATAPRSRKEGFPTKDAGKRLMRDLMRDFDLTKEQAAGVVGNLDYETGGFKFMQEIDPIVPGSKGGYGFAQWTGPRRVAFEEYAAANKLDPSSYEANYGFLKHELANTSEGDIMADLRSTDTADAAAILFSKEFLRPKAETANLQGRSLRAMRYVEDYLPNSLKGK